MYRRYGLVLTVLTTFFVGQIAAACACAMQPGHTPVAVHQHDHHHAHHAHHGDHAGHAVPDHCADPCIVAASTERPTGQDDVARLGTSWTNDAFKSAIETYFILRKPETDSRPTADYARPPPILCTLVALHAQLLT